MKKVLITGAGGCLGVGMQQVFHGHYDMRLMDVAPFESKLGEVFVGDVSDEAAVEQAMQGMDALVIAHMLSRTGKPDAYDSPGLPFDVNVKGTSFLFEHAMKQKIRKVALVSSMGVIWPYRRNRKFMTRDLEPRSISSHYILTKVCQEKIAEHYHLTYGMQVGVLRIGCVCYVDDTTREVRDKYGKVFTFRGVSLADRRDIAEVARRALALDDLRYEVFYVEGTPEAAAECDMEYTYRRLNWKPAYDFLWLKPDEHTQAMEDQYKQDLAEPNPALPVSPLVR